MLEHINVIFALIGVLSLFCQWLGWKLKLPAILPLLIAGLLLGPTLGVLNPDDLFGDLLFPTVSLGVAVILFEGSLTLNFSEIKNHGSLVTRLVSLGTLITWACLAIACKVLFNFEWSLALLFGAIVVVTGPTVIAPMLRSIKPKSELASILRWEGIVIDPIGALLAVLMFEYIAASSDPTKHILYAIAYTLTIGLSFGALTGQAIGIMLRKNLMPHYLRNTSVLTIMIAAFVASNVLQEESGLLTVTIMGIWLANMRGVDIEDIKEFKQTLTVLLISALFIVLAARLNSEALLSLGWEGLILLAIAMFVARPLSVWICSYRTSLTSADKWFLSWVAPRGIVAAAISSLFAIKLESQGVANASKIVPLVFLIIIGTVVIQSFTAGFWAKFLKVSVGFPQGLLIFGASSFSRQLAQVLLEKEIPVVLADNNWENISQARMDNIPVYYGNPASEHADINLDMTGIGRVLIMSPYRQLNPLVSFHFQSSLGAKQVFGLNTFETVADNSRHQLSETYKERLSLFGGKTSYSKLASMMSKGAFIKITNINENYNMEDFLSTHGDTALPLCYLQEGKLKVITDTSLDELPKDNIELISLVTDNPQTKTTGNSETKNADKKIEKKEV
jgi:NhaP-type Na+/H+ or K+/H+ antiporter